MSPGGLLSAHEARSKYLQAREPRRFSERHFAMRAGQRITAAAEKGMTETTFFVPPFELGVPLYRPKAVRDSLVRTLAEYGYATGEVGSYGVHISWKRPKGEANRLAV